MGLYFLIATTIHESFMAFDISCHIIGITPADASARIGAYVS